jgi:hypothetical protein
MFLNSKISVPRKLESVVTIVGSTREKTLEQLRKLKRHLTVYSVGYSNYVPGYGSRRKSNIVPLFRR